MIFYRTMKHLDIRCNICDTPATVKKNFIYMRCHCCDDRRIIDINDHTLSDKYSDYLYSMFNDEFEFCDSK